MIAPPIPSAIAIPATEAPKQNILQLAFEAATSKSKLHHENQALKAEVARLKGELAEATAAAPVPAPAAATRARAAATPAPAAATPSPGIKPAAATVPAATAPRIDGRAALEAALSGEQDPRRRFELAAKLNQTADNLPAMDLASIEAALAVEQDPRRRFALATAQRVAEEALV